MTKELGKISSASFGMGGYQDCMIGLSLTFSTKGGGAVSTFLGAWAAERSGTALWTEESRLQKIGAACMKLADLLKKTGKRDVAELAGAPVEITFDGNRMVDWRLLEEVL